MKRETTKIVIFADLDDTLLDDKYDCVETKPVIRHLLSLNVSIVLTSSKTSREIDFYRTRFAISDPFIVENGSAIFIPQKYFNTNYGYTRQVRGYYIIELGLPYPSVRNKLASATRRTDASIVGFGDMMAKEIAKEARMPLHLAQLAKKREYDEPFKIIEGDEKKVLRSIEEEGLCATKGGRYFHALGNCDKGKAVAILKELYVQKFDKLTILGVGDSPNDASMLELVDKPFLINKVSPKQTISKVWQEILETTVDLLR